MRRETEFTGQRFRLSRRSTPSGTPWRTWRCRRRRCAASADEIAGVREPAFPGRDSAEQRHRVGQRHQARHGPQPPGHRLGRHEGQRHHRIEDEAGDRLRKPRGWHEARDDEADRQDAERAEEKRDGKADDRDTGARRQKAPPAAIIAADRDARQEQLHEHLRRQNRLRPERRRAEPLQDAALAVDRHNRHQRLHRAHGNQQRAQDREDDGRELARRRAERTTSDGSRSVRGPRTGARACRRCR